MKVKVTTYTGTHCIAGCRACDWNAGVHTKETPTNKDVRNAATKHVRKTGHSVWVETAITTHYDPDEGGRTQDALDTPPAVSNVVAESNGVPVI